MEILDCLTEWKQEKRKERSKTLNPATSRLLISVSLLFSLLFFFFIFFFFNEFAPAVVIYIFFFVCVCWREAFYGQYNICEQPVP